MELDGAQDRYGLRFPPDLASLLLDGRIVGGYAWNTDDPRIRNRLAWPLKMLMFDVEQGQWWPGWGKRPDTEWERAEVVRDALAVARALNLMHSHRFLPEDSGEAGNPVFSIHGFDTI